MSTESGQPGRAVPSFGDLFDDPEVPEAAETAAPPVTAAAAEPVAEPEPVAEVEPEPVDVVEAAQEPQQVAFVAPLAEPEPQRAPVQPALDDDLAAALAAPAVAAAAAARPVDTGRLYRSSGAEGPSTLDAIPAIDPEYLAARDARLAEEERKAATAKPAKAPKPARAATDGGAGLTWTGVSVIVIAATVLVGFADALINNSLGLLTGVALLVSSVYCAVTVRRTDIWAPVVMAPLAYVVAALTAGQLTLDGAGSLVVREGYMLLKSLAQGAPWVIGSTLVCLVIVLVRRARTAAAD